jgi:ABC-2 type transport system ATP-binding protein
MSQAEEICDFVFMIHKSKKVFDGPLAEVKQGEGKSIHLAYEGDASGVFDELRRDRLVERVNDAGKEAELVPNDGADPQEILARLVGRVTVRAFDLREASLHEIFVRKVGEVPA